MVGQAPSYAVTPSGDGALGDVLRRDRPCILKSPRRYARGLSFLVEFRTMRYLSDFDPQSLGEMFSSWGFNPSHAHRLLRAYYQDNGDVDLSQLRLGNLLEARF